MKYTKRQHYVPRCYLEQWAKSGRVSCHFLETGSVKQVTPENILVESYYYEDDPVAPDNRIEKILSGIEGKACSVFKKLKSKRESVRSLSNHVALSFLRNAISDDDIDTLLTFAAFQYVRVPGAIAQKKEELAGRVLDTNTSNALRPGQFVERGAAYIKKRFLSMKMFILISELEFLTSDWPCFDLKQSDQAPLLGEEFGRDPDVICCFVIGPNMLAIIYSGAMSDNSRKTDRLTFQFKPDSVVKNQNALVVQQAEKFVVASKEEKFVFTIASKRKKSK